MLATARESGFGVQLDGKRFVAYAAARWPPAQPPSDFSQVFNVGDLYLAAACVHGCPGAVEVFEDQHLRHVPAALGYLKQGPDFVADVQQMVREKLLTAPSGENLKLADYAGRGALRVWVRAVAVRTALHLLEKDRTRERAKNDDSLLDGAAPNVDPESLLLKADARPVVSGALRDALASLSRDQRTLLRLHYVEAMRVTEIATLLKVHKATISRRLDDARAQLHARMRELLVQRLKLSQSDADSLVAHVASQLGVSLVSLLQERTEDT